MLQHINKPIKDSLLRNNNIKIKQNKIRYLNSSNIQKCLIQVAINLERQFKDFYFVIKINDKKMTT